MSILLSARQQRLMANAARDVSLDTAYLIAPAHLDDLIPRVLGASRTKN